MVSKWESTHWNHLKHLRLASMQILWITQQTAGCHLMICHLKEAKAVADQGTSSSPPALQVQRAR